MLFMCINLLSVLDLFLCLLTVAISFCALVFYTAVFVLSVLSIVHVLDLESVCLIPNIYPRITLDMFHILFIVIVDSWDVNEISISISVRYELIPYIKRTTFGL